MKVFYVMVLVLVAGAVPSHGRTESEGTVFNKNQPHESMNNVTVSSSKLEAYDYSYLVMQWPRSFCNSRSGNQRRCHRQVPGIFTVHGLWPQSNLVGCIDCRNRHYPLFNGLQLDGALVRPLGIYWPDLTTREDNLGFWGRQYNKHGSCTFHDQNLYFRLALTMLDRLGDLNEISRIREGRKIIPGYFYSPRDIILAVYKVTHKVPRLECITVGRITLLLEIRFCVNRNGLNLGNCILYSNCGNGAVYFPRPNWHGP